MVLNFLIKVLERLRRVRKGQVKIYPATEYKEEIRSVWDHLKLVENTQAFHMAAVIGFDEWVDMEEIRRRILALFGIEYKNEKSLYPYLKTLSDIGLFEATSAGGRRKWRKKDLIIIIKAKKEEERAKESYQKITA